jgi:chemotaxis protein CheD
MGELAVTADQGVVLTTIGLGSCVGVALLDPGRQVAGLAHVIFPRAPRRAVAEPGRYADTAVPALVSRLGALGSPRSSLLAVLIGGARMFSFERPLNTDVGQDNLKAVRAALGDAQIPIRAEATSGATGRSVRLDAAAGIVSVLERGRQSRLYRAPRAGTTSGAGS